MRSYTKYLGNSYGVLTVLEFAYQKKHRKFFKCICNRCNNITFTRTDHLLKLPKSCGNCVNDLQREIASKKYSKEVTKRNSSYCSYRGNARSRSKKFDLSREDFNNLYDKPCFYCNETPAKGVDRLDSSLGYNLDNCVPCCSMCNRMKNYYTLEKYFSKIEAIYKKHLDKGSTTIPNGSTLQA